MMNIPTSNHDIKRYSIILFACLSALFIFRVFALYTSNTDLFFDEAQYWAWSRNLDFGYFSKPPFLAWSIRSITEMCGMNEFCVRLPSPIFHTLTAIFIYFAGKALYSAQIGFWSALAFATLPGISFSAGLISTDVPLLTFWALSLWAFIEFQNSKSWSWALILGIGIGFGLLSKYAMIFFLLSTFLYIALAPKARWLLTNSRFWCAILIGAVIILPNIIWNMNNGLVTFSHTADNANWKGVVVFPLKALEFFGAQFGVFGPVFFAGLLIILWRFFAYANGTSSKSLNEADKMLLSFSIPVILIITVQAFLSRAHANWAATAYPAATILVMAVLLRDKAWIAIRSSLALHLLLVVLLAAGTASAGRIALPWKNDPFARVLGWKETAEKTKVRLANFGPHAILTDSRDMTAELVYYLRNIKQPIFAWRSGDIPRDYYQMIQPFPGTFGTDKRVLYVTQAKNPGHILKLFSSTKRLGSDKISAGLSKKRTIFFFGLSGFKGNKPK